MRDGKLTRLLAALVLGALLTLFAAACGSDGDSSSDSAQSTTGNETTSEKATTEAEGGNGSAELTKLTTPPTEWTKPPPLKSAPPKGKTLAWLQCDLPICETFTPYFEEATEALGWKLKVIPYKSVEPNSGLITAAAQNVDYIAITGIPAASMKQGLAAAKAADIPVIACSADDEADPSIGYYADCGNTKLFAQQGQQIGEWLAATAGEGADVAVVNLPEYAVLNAAASAFEESCGGCSTGKVDTTVGELAEGKLPTQLGAYLQSHSETDAVMITTSNLLTGLSTAQAEVGSSAELVGVSLDKEVLAALVKEEVAAWTAQPIKFQVYTAVDAAARLAAGETLSKEYQELISTFPTYVVDSPAAAEELQANGDDLWPGPEGFEEEFEELWQVR